MIVTSLKSKGKGFQHCVKYDFKPQKVGRQLGGRERGRVGKGGAWPSCSVGQPTYTNPTLLKTLVLPYVGHNFTLS